MKNTIMLIAITIALVISLTACAKIEAPAQDEREAIITQALEQMDIEAESVDLYFLQENEWLLVADGHICYIRTEDGHVVYAEKDAQIKFVFKGGDDNV